MGSSRTQRGSALMLVLMVMGALLLAGGIGTGLYLLSLRTSGQVLVAKRAYFCAEAGLAAGRSFFAQNAASWDSYLQSGFVYTGQAAIAGGLPYTVSISDNRDEVPPQPDDPKVDRDHTVVLESTCVDPGLNTQIALRQHLTLNPINDTSGLPVTPGPATYTATPDFTAGAPTDLQGGIAGMPPPQVAASAVDLRLDRIALQAGQGMGTWTVRQYCAASCNGWQSIAWAALQPPGTLVTVRARSATTYAGLAGAAWQPVASGVARPQLGPGSLRGRFIEVQVILQSAVPPVTPIVDSVTITPYGL